MSDTGEHPAAEPKAPAGPDLLWTIAKWVVGQEWLMRFAAVAVLVAVGGAAVVYAQDAGVKLIAPVEVRVTALEKSQADMQRMTLETNATVKMIAYRLGVVPLSLTEAKDGGQ